MRLGWALSQARRLLARHPLDVLTFAIRRVPRIPRVLLETRRARRTPLPRAVPATPGAAAADLLRWDPLPLPDGAREHGRQWLEEGIIHLFGSPVETGWPPRWDPAQLGDFGDGASHDIAYYGDAVEHDIKRPWELQRHWLLPAVAQVIVETEDETERLERAAAFVDVLLDWGRHHPPLRTIAWMEGIEVTLRLIAWTDALARLPASAYADEDRAGRLATILAEHAHFLRTHLSRKWRLNNNHLLLELVGLVVAGASQTAAPLKQRARWFRVGTRLLQHELTQQVPDGRDWEPTTAYHRFVTEAVLVARNGWVRMASDRDDRGPREIVDTLNHLDAKLRTMIESLAWITDHAGHIPLVGDDDAGVVLPRAADWSVTDASQVLDLARHLGFEVPDPEGIRVWPEVGMGVLRIAPYHVHLTAGAPRGPGRQGSHRHLDMLSASVSVDGQPILIDPGTGLYFSNRAWRDHFRTARVHSGIWSPSMPWADLKDLFEVPKPPLGRFETGDAVLTASVRHRGHRTERRVHVSDEVCVVTDTTSLPDAHWSFPVPRGAEWRLTDGELQIRRDQVLLTHGSGLVRADVNEVRADPVPSHAWDQDVIDGAVSPGYGQLAPGLRLEVGGAIPDGRRRTVIEIDARYAKGWPSDGPVEDE